MHMRNQHNNAAPVPVGTTIAAPPGTLWKAHDRFARDLTVQLTGHDFLKSLGISLIPATAPDFFTEDTPTAVLVRQVLGAIAQFEKTSLVAKLKAARDRKEGGHGEMRRPKVICRGPSRNRGPGEEIAG